LAVVFHQYIISAVQPDQIPVYAHATIYPRNKFIKISTVTGSTHHKNCFAATNL